MASVDSNQNSDEAPKLLTEGCSTDQEPEPPPVEIPAVVWPGMSLHWDSPFRDVTLRAELPFWLLVGDCTLRVTVRDCTLEVSITGSAIEIQRGKAYRDSHSNTALIEKTEAMPSDRAATILRDTSQGGFTMRTTRTLVSIQTRVLGDVLAAVREGGRRRIDADIYLRSFVHAHLPFVNKTINAYRRAAADPFAVDVTEWDVPSWYLDVDEEFIPISLIPYKATGERPVLYSIKGEPSYITFVEPNEIEQALNLPEVPGELDLLDAWSLYYRGRQSDAIRSLVTSLEVLLEAKLRESLENRGLDEAQVQSRLDESWNNFQYRLTDYVQVSHRRVPGPILSIFPYVNGVRLRDELEQVRSLRHKIVHNGERISYPFHGQTVLSEICCMLCSQAEQPLGGGLNLPLGHPAA